ncbi:hypothetical protein [Allorhizocola rhizosphaerae]|uniref:hypothetical protein n=1 Tax=Allorhizocola rhizosphaerae TaxID=1872709 RepID=UPI000E3E1CB2|nr:hypothetical protein [Allorhizocola rhizosphaerae]
MAAMLSADAYAQLDWLYELDTAGHELNPWNQGPVRVPGNVERRVYEEIKASGFAAPYGQEMANGYANLIKLTALGRQHMQDVTQLRSNRRARASACRDQLLRWYDQLTEPNASPADYVGSSAAHFYGTPFTHEEAMRAGQHLEADGYLENTGASLAGPSYQITLKGERVAEERDGNISAWEQNQRPAGNTTILNVNAGTINGMTTTQLTNSTIEGNLTVSSNSNAQVDRVKITEWLDGIQQLLPMLQLPSAGVARIENAVAELRTQLTTAQAEPSLLRKLGNLVIEALTSEIAGSAIAAAPQWIAGVIATGQQLLS